MKTIGYYLVWILVAAMPLSFTSCDPDVRWDDYDYWDDPYNNGGDYLIGQAQALAGSWTGKIQVEYYDKNGQYQKNLLDTDFFFKQYNDNAINGTGYEVDYSGNKKVYDCDFRWYIDPSTRDIMIKYDDGRYLRSSNFKLDQIDRFGYANRFRGVLNGIDGSEKNTFELYRPL